MRDTLVDRRQPERHDDRHQPHGRPARARGAAVIAIVNRRSSDLADKADGVLYTSDGRDVEMSVASTKAFYAQVAAGALLACAITEAAGSAPTGGAHELLAALRELPEAMRAVLAKRDEIADAARRFAPPKRYWAVVGNGPNRVAAEEVRIKLSELCYKSIACDVDRGQEAHRPLVGAADPRLRRRAARQHRRRRGQGDGDLPGPQGNADRDRRRGRASATARRRRSPCRRSIRRWRSCCRRWSATCSATRRRSPSTARRARCARRARRSSARSRDSGDGDAVLDVAAHASSAPYAAPLPRRACAITSTTDISRRSTAVRLVGLLRDLMSPKPVEEYAASSGKVGTPAALIDELVGALTRAIEELTRPIDAIKHQAKTVTVGISRSDEGVVDRALVQATLARRCRPRRAHVPHAQGARRPRSGGRRGHRLHPLSRRRQRRSRSSTATGSRRDLPSPGRQRLAARRHQAPRRRRSARCSWRAGRRDQRTVIFVPEVKAGTCTGITLLHVRFHDRLDAAVMKGVLQGYDNRYSRLVDWVSETEGEFDESKLAELPVADALIEPISDTADLWTITKAATRR